MKKCHYLILFLIVFLLAGLSYSSEKGKNGIWYWQQGLKFARTAQPDSAYQSLQNSFNKGLSDDSLYYLWAEIYLYKGIFDTALALNLSTKPSDRSAISRLVYEQRYLIYSMLGWEKEARSLLDSTTDNHQSGIWHRLLPECVIYLSGGGYTENNVTNKQYPYPRITDSIEALNNGTGIATVRLGWNIPVGKTQKLQIGARTRYSSSRFSYALTKSLQEDSGNSSIGGYMRYSLLSNKFAVSYSFSRKSDYRNATSFTHNATVHYTFITADYLGTIEGCYQVETPVDDRYYYLMTWWNRVFREKHDVSVDLFLSGFSADNYQYSAQGYVYFNNGFLYFDPLLQNPFKATLARTMLDTLHANTMILGYWSFNPNIRYEYLFNKRFSAGFGTGYTMTWYRGKNIWADYRYGSPGAIPFNGVTRDYNLLALNIQDQTFYWVNRLGSFIDSTGSGSINTDLPVIFYTKQRIDQTISLNLFIKTSLGIFGEMLLEGALRRNYSTLMGSAPVDIQKWYSEITLSWFFRFKPGRIR